MKIHKIWATLVGTASFVIGLLRFFNHRLGQNIPAQDGIIHIITGIGFLGGAWLFYGKYVRRTNLWLGFIYILFGIAGVNWPHIIAGIISVLLGLTIKNKIATRQKL